MERADKIYTEKERITQNTNHIRRHMSITDTMTVVCTFDGVEEASRALVGDVVVGQVHFGHVALPALLYGEVSLQTCKLAHRSRAVCVYVYV